MWGEGRGEGFDLSYGHLPLMPDPYHGPMQVTVNGEPRDLEPGTTVGALLTQLGLDKAVCAAEVNHEVVPRRDRDARELREGDVVELVTLVGGG